MHWKHDFNRMNRLLLVFMMIAEPSFGISRVRMDSNHLMASHLAPIKIGTWVPQSLESLSQSDSNHPEYRSHYFESVDLSENNVTNDRPQTQKKLIVRALEAHLNQKVGDTWGDFWNEVLREAPVVIELQAEKVIVDSQFEIPNSRLVINAFELQINNFRLIKSAYKTQVNAFEIYPGKSLKSFFSSPQMKKTALFGVESANLEFSNHLSNQQMAEIVFRRIDFIRKAFILEDYPKVRKEILAILPAAQKLSEDSGVKTAELELTAMQSRLNANLNYFGHRSNEVPFYTPAFQFQQLEEQIDHYLDSIEYITTLEFQKDLADYRSEALRKTIEESQLEADQAFSELKQAQNELRPLEHQFKSLSAESELLADILSRDLKYFLQLARDRKFAAIEDRKRLAVQNRLVALVVQGASLYLLGPIGVASAQDLVNRLQNPPKPEDDPDAQIEWQTME